MSVIEVSHFDIKKVHLNINIRMKFAKKQSPWQAIQLSR